MEELIGLIPDEMQKILPDPLVELQRFQTSRYYYGGGYRTVKIWFSTSIYLGLPHPPPSIFPCVIWTEELNPNEDKR